VGIGQPVEDSEMDFIVANCHLKSLYIEDNPKITDEGIETLVLGFPNLEELRVKNCPAISNASLHLLAKTCNSLQVLDLQGCSLITDEGVAAVANALGSLTYLNVAAIPLSNKPFEAIGKLKELEGLDIAEIDTITDAAFTYLKDLIKLNNISLASCTNITHTGISTLCHQNFPLKSLNLEQCNFLQDNALEAIGKSKFASTLQGIVLSGLKKITDTGIKALVQGCESLKKIQLNGCQRINNSGKLLYLL
jgi:hypothetical protein